MNNLDKVYQTIVQLDSQLKATDDPAEQQRIKSELQTLSKYVTQQKSKTKEEPKTAVDQMRERAEVDPMGVGNAIVAGLNKGLLSTADLPLDLINMAISSVESLTGLTLPKTANISEAIDFVTKPIAGFGFAEAATTPKADVDTPTERIINRIAEFGAGGLGTGAVVKEGAQRVAARQAITPVETTAQRLATSQGVLPRETISGAGAGLGFGVAEETLPDSPLVQLGAAVVGGATPNILGSTGRAAAGRVRETARAFTEAGAKKRVGDVIATNATDIDTALDNLASNKELINRLIPEAEQMPVQLMTEDPGIQRTINAALKDDNQLINVLQEGVASNDEQVAQALQRAATEGTPQTFLNRTQAAMNKAVDQLNKELEAAKDIAVKIEESIQTGQATPEISSRFVRALETSFNRARQRETELWSLVDNTERIDVKALKKRVKKLNKTLKNQGVATATFPDELFKEAGTFGKNKNTFEALQNYRSAVLEAVRQANAAGNYQRARALKALEKELFDVIQDSGNTSAHAAASQYTRTMRTLYNKGKIGRFLNIDLQGESRIDPENALSQIVRQSDNIADARRAVILEKGVGEIPPAQNLTDSIEDFLKTKFAEASPKERSNFANKYRNVLRLFPELSRDLTKMADSIDVAAQNVASKENRVKSALDVKQTAVAALLGAEPDQIFPRIKNLSKTDLRAIRDVAEAENVLDGLQSVYIREIVNRVLTTDGIVQRNAIPRLLNENAGLRRGFENILSPEQRKKLLELQKISNTLRPPEQGAMASNVANLFEASMPAQVLARLLGVRLASVVAPSGPSALTAAGVFSRTAQRLINNLPSSHTQRLLEQMVVDPDLFEEVVKLGRTPNLDPEAARQALKAYYGLVGSEAVEDDNASP